MRDVHRRLFTANYHGSMNMVLHSPNKVQTEKIAIFQGPVPIDHPIDQTIIGYAPRQKTQLRKQSSASSPNFHIWTWGLDWS